MKTFPVSQLQAQKADTAAILRAFGGHNWPAEAIEAHKAKELALAPPPSVLWHYHDSVRAIIRPICQHGVEVAGLCAITAAIFAVIATATYVASWLFFPDTTAYETEFRIAIRLIVASVASFLLSEIAWWISNFHVRPPAQWQALQHNCFMRASLPPEAKRPRPYRPRSGSRNRRPVCSGLGCRRQHHTAAGLTTFDTPANIWRVFLYGGSNCNQQFCFYIFSFE